MEAERESNKKLIEEKMNKFVTIGSDIQIYHIYSKSFIRVTREKNSRQSGNLCKIKLSQNIRSGMHFKIKANPLFNFKKENEKISFDDRFILENFKLKTCIANKNLPEIWWLRIEDQAKRIETKKIKGPSNKKGEINISKKKKNIEIVFPSILEKEGLFLAKESGHSKDFISTFEVNFLKNSFVEKENMSLKSKQICWGDCVRVKNVRENKQIGFLYSQFNIAGIFPKVFYGIHENKYSSEQESSSAIFEIIPLDYEDYGKPIHFCKFNNENLGTVSFLLRHFLTGFIF